MDLLIRKCFDGADVMMDDDIGRHFDCFYHQNKYFDYYVDNSVYFVDPIAPPSLMTQPSMIDFGNRYAVAVVGAAIVDGVAAVVVAVIAVAAVAGVVGVAAVGVVVEIVVAVVVDEAAVAVVGFAYLNLIEHLFGLTNQN